LYLVEKMMQEYCHFLLQRQNLLLRRHLTHHWPRLFVRHRFHPRRLHHLM
jgi:hypothetical protein